MTRWLGGSVACTAASQQEGPGFDSRMGLCWYWGQVLTRPSVLRWAISRAFLWGLHVFPVFTRVSSTKNPNRKTCRRTEHSCPSLRRKVQLVPGPRSLRSCPLLLEDPGGGTIRDGLKAEVEFTATSGQ